jgi:hypothetical protein
MSLASVIVGGTKNMIKRSCEDPARIYVELFGKRYIFEGLRYIGWYQP